MSDLKDYEIIIMVPAHHAIQAINLKDAALYAEHLRRRSPTAVSDMTSKDKVEPYVLGIREIGIKPLIDDNNDDDDCPNIA